MFSASYFMRFVVLAAFATHAVRCASMHDEAARSVEGYVLLILFAAARILVIILSISNFWFCFLILVLRPSSLLQTPRPLRKMAGVTMVIVGPTATLCPTFGATRRVPMLVEGSLAQATPTVALPGSALRLVIFERMVSAAK
jgi:hypothetical protein